MSIFDVKERRWISHKLIQSVRTSSLYVIDRSKETSKVLWLDDKKTLQVYSNNKHGSLDEFKTVPVSGRIIKIFDNDLKKNEG